MMLFSLLSMDFVEFFFFFFSLFYIYACCLKHQYIWCNIGDFFTRMKRQKQNFILVIYDWFCLSPNLNCDSISNKTKAIWNETCYLKYLSTGRYLLCRCMSMFASSPFLDGKYVRNICDRCVLPNISQQHSINNKVFMFNIKSLIIPKWRKSK